MKFWKLVGFILTGTLLLLIGVDALAAAPSVTVSLIANNIGTTVTQTAKILQDLSLIAGIGFIMASFFKFHQHKLNPTQVPMSQGVTLLVIGAGLTLFPILIPTAGSTVLGSKASVSKVSGSGITGLIGGGGGSQSAGGNN
ncbi:MAG: type IV secretion protein IcmD [Coxiellaceae bacterium]|nr:type IV secretion protein IcmD [Coxiellaceae bacterium]